MEQVTAYTDTNAIRASIGVDSADCEDSLIIDSNLELELEVDLEEWLPTHATIFSTGNGSGATLSQKLQKNYLLLYAQWFCAYELVCRFLAIPQIVSDGKNQINRFATIDLNQVKTLAGERKSKYRQKLDAAVNSSSVSQLTLMRISTPNYDPVTNV
jgi:hypothetical protein